MRSQGHICMPERKLGPLRPQVGRQNLAQHRQQTEISPSGRALLHKALPVSPIWNHRNVRFLRPSSPVPFPCGDTTKNTTLSARGYSNSRHQAELALSSPTLFRKSFEQHKRGLAAILTVAKSTLVVRIRHADLRTCPLPTPRSTVGSLGETHPWMDGTRGDKEANAFITWLLAMITCRRPMVLGSSEHLRRSPT
jgi:hypothetical protein